MTAIGPIVRTGMMAIEYMMMCTTWMSVDTSRRNEKEKERKARMMKAKEESQEMEKANQTMFNLRSHQLLLLNNKNNNNNDNNDNNDNNNNNNNVAHHCRKFIREQDILSFTDFTAHSDLCTGPTAHSSLFCCLAIV